MENVFKILAVFVLLMLVIVYSIQIREKRFRPFAFANRINLTPLELPGKSMTSATILPEPGGRLATDSVEGLSFYPGEPDTQLVVSDSATGSILHLIQLEEPIGTLLFDPNARLIFCANREGGLVIVRQNNRETYKIVQRLSIPRGVQDIALDPEAGKLYVHDTGAIYVYSNAG